MEKYDLIVLGSGPAGQRAAVQAAKLKKKVLIVEKDHIGGASLQSGTIPSKTLREAALYYGGQANPLASVMATKNRVITDERKVIQNQLQRNGVAVATGTGSFVSPTEISVNDGKKDQRYSTSFVVIAVGTRPWTPPDVKMDNEFIFDSDTVLQLKHLPKRLAVIGAGVIGCEYASIFNRLGVSVTLLDRRKDLLRMMDLEIIKTLETQFTESKILMKMGSEFANIRVDKSTVCVDIDRKTEAFDALLVCLGRTGNIESLNLSAIGISPGNRGLLEVNKSYQTKHPNIYAVGDIIGHPALASASYDQGRMAAAHAFNLPAEQIANLFPYGIYTIPEISCVGAQEQELTEKKIEYVVGRAKYSELARGKILNDSHGILKLLVDKKSRNILGVHIIGSGATELVHIGQTAMASQTKLDFFINNVFNFPTLAEAYKVAAYNAYNQL